MESTTKKTVTFDCLISEKLSEQIIAAINTIEIEEEVDLQREQIDSNRQPSAKNRGYR